MKNHLGLNIVKLLAAETGCRDHQVEAFISLLDEGATIPFIARYRKEATGGLDDVQLRLLDDRLKYLKELAERKTQIEKMIATQGQLTPVLKLKIQAAETKAELEDIYSPFKTKVKTRARIALENGLGPLVDRLVAEPKSDPELIATGFLNDAVPTISDALTGVRDILAERIADNPDTAKRVREKNRRVARLACRVVEGMETQAEKYKDYFTYEEKWSDIPSHRALALLRASKQGLVNIDLVRSEEDIKDIKVGMASDNQVNLTNPVLSKAVDWAWRVKLANRVHSDLVNEMRERAERDAIDVFAKNLKNLLMAPPAGHKVTMGLDPGIRTGVKVAVVSKTGKLLETATVYPFQPQNDLTGTVMKLKRLIETHGVELIAIGNGTASRETEKVASEVIARLDGPKPAKIIVSEAGASVYSASEIASREMPSVDVSLRGAVSIARRLQDPLAELVKIEPKAIGVGQYQHDVDEAKLERALSGAVEDAVNSVGVDVNTASPSLLAHVAGLGPSLAQAIVDYRNQHGPFTSRNDLLKVPRLGEKAFRQCAGFLRIRDGDEPLDSSAVHPEAYDLAREIISKTGLSLMELMKSPKTLSKIKLELFVNERFGLPTVKDIVEELKKPGRDPRPEFKMAKLADSVQKMEDLRPGMKLEGTITNVAAFGAFVDIGVHQDGLVHVSQLSDQFVKEPSAVAKVGDIVKVTVISVDLKARKIGLSMKSQPEYGQVTNSTVRPDLKSKPVSVSNGNAFADAFARARK